jgi:hypothetical protein
MSGRSTKALYRLTEEKNMPVIIVKPNGTAGASEAFTLSESVIPSELHDDHYISHLIQRLGWALVDAEDIESEAPA